MTWQLLGFRVMCHVYIHGSSIFNPVRIFHAIPGQVRERDWCNVITAHEGDPAAYVWRLQHFTIGEHRLVPPLYVKRQQAGAAAAAATAASGAPDVVGVTPNAPVTCVALSPCGNYGVVSGGVWGQAFEWPMMGVVLVRARGVGEPMDVVGVTLNAPVTCVALSPCGNNGVVSWIGGEAGGKGVGRGNNHMSVSHIPHLPLFLIRMVLARGQWVSLCLPPSPTMPVCFDCLCVLPASAMPLDGLRQVPHASGCL